MSYLIGMDLTNTRPVLIPGNTSTGPEFRLGTLGMRSDGKRYKYVSYSQGAGSIAAVAGNVVGYLAPGGDFAAEGFTNNLVTSDVSDALVAGGVLQAVIPHLGFGWIQIKGSATLTTPLVSGADGQALVLSTTTDGTLKVAGAVTDTLGVCYAQDASDKTVVCNFPE